MAQIAGFPVRLWNQFKRVDKERGRSNWSLPVETGKHIFAAVDNVDFHYLAPFFLRRSAVATGVAGRGAVDVFIPHRKQTNGSFPFFAKSSAH